MLSLAKDDVRKLPIAAALAPSRFVLYNLGMGSGATIQLPPLTKQSMTELVAKAKRLGIEPGIYARRLIEEGLAFQREAESSSFAEIMGPVRKTAGDVDEAEITRLVETARTEYHAAHRRKKR